MSKTTPAPKAAHTVQGSEEMESVMDVPRLEKEDKSRAPNPSSPGPLPHPQPTPGMVFPLNATRSGFWGTTNFPGMSSPMWGT